MQYRVEFYDDSELKELGANIFLTEDDGKMLTFFKYVINPLQSHENLEIEIKDYAKAKINEYLVEQSEKEQHDLQIITTKSEIEIVKSKFDKPIPIDTNEESK